MQGRVCLKLLMGRQLHDLEGCHLFLPVLARGYVLLVEVLMRPQSVGELQGLASGVAVWSTILLSVHSSLVRHRGHPVGKILSMCLHQNLKLRVNVLERRWSVSSHLL